MASVSAKMSPKCEGVVLRSIHLLEELRSVVKECKMRDQKVEKLMEETRKCAHEEDEKKTFIQINVIIEILKEIRDSLLAKRAGMLQPLQEIAGSKLNLFSLVYVLCLLNVL